MDSSAERLVWYQRGISILPQFGNVASHLNYLRAKSSGTSSSHSLFLFHNSCVINFGSRTAGVTTPSGSKMVLVKLRISLSRLREVFYRLIWFSVCLSVVATTPQCLVSLEFRLGLCLFSLQCLLMTRTLKCCGYLTKTSLS